MEDLLRGWVSFSDDIGVALMNDTHLFNASDKLWEDINGSEIYADNSYTPGGEVLKNLTITREPNNIMIDADDIVWYGASFELRHVVLYFRNSRRLICSFDMDYNRKGHGYKLTLKWHNRGIMTEPSPDDPPQYLIDYLKKGGD